MYVTSEEFDEIVESGNAVYSIRITRTSDDTVLNLNIDNFEYIGSKCAHENITFGNALCQSVKFSIHNPSVRLENEELFIEQGLELEDESMEYVPIGYFIVQKPVSDGEVTTYTCYDRMIKLEGLYANENQYVNVFDVLYDISKITGVTINRPDTTKNYFIDTGQMSQWDDLFTMREVVGYLGGLYGKDAIVDRDGEIVFKWYESTGYAIDGNLMYQGSTKIESEYDMEIEKIVVRKQLPGYETEEYTEGSGLKTVYADNPFTNESIVEETFERVEGLTFRGLTTEFLGDFRIDLGDIISVTKDNHVYPCCVMEISHKSDGGVRTKIICHQKTESEQKFSYTGSMTRNLNRDSDALAEIKAVVNEHETEINELFSSVSNGKEAIASAITDKGVETSSTDTFSTMANNIEQIPSGTENPTIGIIHIQNHKYGKVIDAIIGAVHYQE